MIASGASSPSNNPLPARLTAVIPACAGKPNPGTNPAAIGANLAMSVATCFGVSFITSNGDIPRIFSINFGSGCACSITSSNSTCS